MDMFRRMAFLLVGRACGFAALGIVCVVLALSFDPVLAARSGGVMSLILTLSLILKAQLAQRQDYRRTELWLMLPQEYRPPKAYAQWLSALVLRQTYLWYAHYCAAITVIFALVAVLLPLVL